MLRHLKFLTQGKKKLISSQTSNDKAAPKLLRRSKGGIKCSFPDAHISDSSDSNSIDSPNDQPDKYHSQFPSPHDPNDGKLIQDQQMPKRNKILK